MFHSTSSRPEKLPIERRRRLRYPTRIPARVRLTGLRGALDAEIHDLSSGGCYLAGDDLSFMAVAGDELALGFHAHDAIALAHGRVVRCDPGMGLGVELDRQNDVLDGVLGVLAALG